MPISLKSKEIFHGGVMVCTGPVNLGGKPTDASMILVSKPYKEMANSTRQKCLTDRILKFFLQRFLKVDNYI